ncbi:MAG: pyruvate synthase subunit PorA [Candidatus Hadarchaeales archaeon]
MKEFMNGNEAAALGAKLARVKVISAYPITPQTVVVEKLADYVADGELDAEYIKVESEHSALSACIGAAATGVRAFTATSSQGLILMSEIMYIASGLRIPLVMANANRSLSAPLSIWNDQQDSMAVRDSGWIQIYCENNQEILDSVIQAFRIAEEALLPVMVCYDGYILSHTSEPVDVPSKEDVDGFLPPYRYPHPLDPERPVTIGAVGVPEYYEEFRHQLQEAMLQAKWIVARVGDDYGRTFGRKYGLMECYRCEDAEIIAVTMGSLAGTLRKVIDDYRKEGSKVGLVKLRLYRPFPAEELAQVLSGARGVCVMEKDISPGATGGLFSDVASAFVNRRDAPVMLNFVCGLGGRDVTEEQIREALKETFEAARSGKSEKVVRWLGLRETVVGDIE